MDGVSVIIPARDAGATLGEQLQALSAQASSPPFEVLVVDDGSQDDTATVARSVSNRLDLRVMSTGIVGGGGVGVARNAGVRAARHDLLLFCDADDRVGPSWVLGHWSCLQDHALSTGPVRNFTTGSSALLHVRSQPPTDAPPATSFLPYAIGANLGSHRAWLEGVGGFRVEGAEDVAFSWQVQLDGGSLGFDARAAVEYRLRPTLRSTIRQQYSYALHDQSLRASFGLPMAPFASRRRRRLLRQPAGCVSPDAVIRAKWWVDAAWASGELVGVRRERRRP